MTKFHQQYIAVSKCISGGHFGQFNTTWILLVGPALYAFNDADFTEDDWEGIQRAGRSIKHDDPTKVGRFGIGFNSVYHVTGKRSAFFCNVCKSMTNYQ